MKKTATKLSLPVLSLLLLLLLGGLFPNTARARVYLELDSPNLRRVPIAVAPLIPLCGSSEDQKVAETGRRILLDDLEFSTFFELLADPSTYLEKPKKCNLTKGTFDFRNWSLIGAELLLKTGYSGSETGWWSNSGSTTPWPGR